MTEAQYNALKASFDSLWQQVSVYLPTVVPDGPPVLTSLAAVNTFPGTDVVLAPGDYSGHLVLTRATPLNLILANVTIYSPDNQPALDIKASNITIAGGSFTCAHPAGTAILVGSSIDPDPSHQPRNVTLINPVVFGDSTKGLKRGMSLHGININVLRPTVTDIKASGEDSNGIWINNGEGPYVIKDGFIQAAAENILTGGDDPRIPGCTPADILIENCVISKPLDWKGSPWQVKNLIELKNSRRVVMRGNTLTGCWSQAQTGYAVLFTVRNQGGNAPWSTVEDILFENNTISDVSSAFQIHGDDDLRSSMRSARIIIQDNHVSVSRALHGGDGRVMTIGRAPQEVSFLRNITSSDGSSAIYSYRGGAVTTSPGCRWDFNTFYHRNYGFLGAGCGNAKDSMTTYYPGGTFTSNTVIGGGASYYPAGTIIA